MNSPAIDLWYLPPSVAPPTATCEQDVRRLPLIDVATVESVVAALDGAAPALAALGVNAIVAAIDAALACWRRPDDPRRAALLRFGPRLTGYSAAALQYAADVMLARFDAAGLERLLAEEIGDARALDAFVDCEDVRRRALGPGRQFHVFAGTVPTVPIFSMICGLLVKSPVLAKPSSRDPLLPALFAQTLARAEPRLAPALAVLPWSGGNAPLEDSAMAGAGAVVVYGADGTLAALRARAPVGARFIGYGHRLSVAGIGREALTVLAAEETARQLAWDVALFDGHGCLSPQVAFVEDGGEVEPRAFATLLGRALDELARTLPRGAVSLAEAARIRLLRETAAYLAASGADVWVFQSEQSTSWTVLYHGDQRTGLSGCPNRVISIVRTDSLERALPEFCAGLPVSTIGLSAPPERLALLAEALARYATRICPIGVMGEPPVTWRHDGRPNLADLVTWVDLETSGSCE